MYYILVIYNTKKLSSNKWLLMFFCRYNVIFLLWLILFALSIGYVSQLVVLPVHNYRSEVILFVRGSDETKLYAWAGVDNGFSEISLPLCHEKLSGNN